MIKVTLFILLVTALVLDGTSVMSIAQNSSIQQKKELTVKLDEEIYITLEVNRGEGYKWDLAEPLNESVVKLVRISYKKTVIPGIEKQTLTFRGMGAGKADLALKCAKFGEENVPDKNKKAFVISVQK